MGVIILDQAIFPQQPTTISLLQLLPFYPQAQVLTQALTSDLTDVLLVFAPTARVPSTSRQPPNVNLLDSHSYVILLFSHLIQLQLQEVVEFLIP